MTEARAIAPRPEGVRLQKVLADRGVTSRRKAEALIIEGRVRVDGAVVSELGVRVRPDARIALDGRAVAVAPPRRYILVHKPRGILSSAVDERGRQSVAELLRASPVQPSLVRQRQQAGAARSRSAVGARERLYPVGRLDVDSEGLLIVTNDGDWAQRVLHPRYGHEREYEVTVTGPVDEGAVARLHRGVRLEEGLARAERVRIVSRERNGGRLRLVLRTGWRRQVRRMCLLVGLRVVRLVRVRMGPLHLGRLRPGEWRELVPREVAALTGGGEADPKREMRPTRGNVAAARRRPGAA